jgi:hypothetical protein
MPLPALDAPYEYGLYASKFRELASFVDPSTGDTRPGLLDQMIARLEANVSAATIVQADQQLHELRKLIARYEAWPDDAQRNAIDAAAVAATGDASLDLGAVLADVKLLLDNAIAAARASLPTVSFDGKDYLAIHTWSDHAHGGTEMRPFSPDAPGIVTLRGALVAFRDAL